MANATRHGKGAIVAIPKNYDSERSIEVGKTGFTDEDIREMVELGAEIKKLRRQLIEEGKMHRKIKA